MLHAPGPFGVRSHEKLCSFYYMLYKMENNYETLRIPDLKALAKECGLRGYSRLRKAELIELLQGNGAQRPPRMPSPLRGATWESQRRPQTEVSNPLVGHPNGKQPEGPGSSLGSIGAPLMKHQLKCR